MLDSGLDRELQSHQKCGHAFMWDSCFEGEPGGCILAHSMGLGEWFIISSVWSCIPKAIERRFVVDEFS